MIHQVHLRLDGGVVGLDGGGGLRLRLHVGGGRRPRPPVGGVLPHRLCEGDVFDLEREFSEAYSGVVREFAKSGHCFSYLLLASLTLLLVQELILLTPVLRVRVSSRVYER